MFRIRLSRVLLAASACTLVLIGATPVLAQDYGQPYDGNSGYVAPDAGDAQSPGRVARLAYTSGDVQFAPAGDDNWGSIDVNRPMVIGDRLVTGDAGRAVLELGDASVRIDNDSAFDFLNLAQDNVQIELSQGTLNLAVRNLDSGENFEVDTPTVAFVAAQPGVYRIDNAPDGNGSMVTVFQGSGTVYGENGASRQVQAGTSYRFNDSALASVDVTGIPQPDDFDQFCEARDNRYNNYAQQQQYVPPDMIGGEDLYQYGQWSDTPEYGNVWYPQVAAGWAPYRDGHWAWIDPWGWTWVDNEPWGFAPFHYGRWAYIGNRWGWLPGQVRMQPTYAPALVAFIGGSGFSLSISLGGGGGGPVGWFPLGPRDVYVPPFQAPRSYFNNVNITNIRNVYVNQTVINNIYNDYSTNQVTNINRYNRYAYRNAPNAVTVVPRNVFTGARQVRAAVLRTNGTQLARGAVMVRPAVVPGRDSLGLRRPVARPAVLHERTAFTRPVVARHAPPPRPVSFAAREKVIAQQHGAPVSAMQMRQLRARQPATNQRPERVKLIPAAALMGGAAAIAAGRNNTRPAARVPAPNDGRFHNQIHPIPANGQLHPVPATQPQPSRNTAPRPDEMRSARFRTPQQQPSTAGRLPVVRPVVPAATGSRAEQQQQRAREQQAQAAQLREAQMQAQQRARAQQMQQQRQAQMQQQQQAQMQQREAQMQAQQRARAQQMQQQRQAQMQQQQQAQMQQREAQMQAQQRARAQQMQQQRQAQMQQQQQAQMQQREAQMQAQQQRARAQQPRYNAPQNRERPPREVKQQKHPPESSSQPWR